MPDAAVFSINVHALYDGVMPSFRSHSIASDARTSVCLFSLLLARHGFESLKLISSFFSRISFLIFFLLYSISCVFLLLF